MVIFSPETDDPYQVSDMSVQMECPYCAVWMDLAIRGRIMLDDSDHIPLMLLLGIQLSDVRDHLEQHRKEEL